MGPFADFSSVGVQNPFVKHRDYAGLFHYIPPDAWQVDIADIMPPIDSTRVEAELPPLIGPERLKEAPGIPGCEAA
jgi:hypothetical protein